MNAKRFSLIIPTLLILAGLSACRKNEVEPTTTHFGYNYFPLDSGYSWIYRVDSVVYDDYVAGGTIDTIRYWVKHTVVDDYIDGQGNMSYRLSRFIKTDSAAPFTYSTELTARIINFRAELEDSSGRYVKLSFPPSLYKYWDGNAYNSKESEEYQIIQVSDREQVGAKWYDSTIHVLHRDDEFFIQKRYELEKYAAGVGLIYTSTISWDLDIRDTVQVKKGSETQYWLEEFTP
ncbi:MAG: hypothetical protein KDC76_04330 [Bacteroidetes bacterium]|nr:hypothetical protein [Bacteroidota bacterium]